MKIGTIAALAAALTLAGCGSPPSHFFMLTAATPEGTPVQIQGPPIEVATINLPPVLDRQSLVVGTGGTSVSVSGSDRWAAPLEGMIQRVLADDLQSLLPGEVLRPGDPTPRGGTRTLQVNITHFMPDESGMVRLTADWALFSHSRQEAGGHEDIRVAAARPKPEEETAAMSQALGRLAQRIAVQVPQHRR